MRKHVKNYKSKEDRKGHVQYPVPCNCTEYSFTTAKHRSISYESSFIYILIILIIIKTNLTQKHGLV